MKFRDFLKEIEKEARDNGYTSVTGEINYNDLEIGNFVLTYVTEDVIPEFWIKINTELPSVNGFYDGYYRMVRKYNENIAEAVLDFDVLHSDKNVFKEEIQYEIDLMPKLSLQFEKIPFKNSMMNVFRLEDY